MVLIHTALLCEAQAIIEYYKLIKINKSIYKNEKIMLVISGIGAKNTSKVLNDIFKNNNFKIAINVGIAGCKDKNVKIGEVFCTNCKLEKIKFASLSSVSKPTQDIKTTLADMEAEAFEEICKFYNIEFYIIKIVSDYLQDDILQKDFVKKLIKESLNQWKFLI